MNKVVYVEASFKPTGKTKTVKVPTGEIKPGLFGGEKKVMRKEEQWEQTGWSESEIDGEKLAADIADAVKTLNSDGYEVVCISEITSGKYNWAYKSSGINNGGYGYGYGYGFSYTEGATIIAKKSNE